MRSYFYVVSVVKIKEILLGKKYKNLRSFVKLHRTHACCSKKKRSFRTYGSRVVPHLSTRHAQRCLTSEFGWDLVIPPWYDRMTTQCNFTRTWNLNVAHA